jgi:hypothetical protein
VCVCCHTTPPPEMVLRLKIVQLGVLPCNVTGWARVENYQTVKSGRIEVVPVCCGSFRVGNLGKSVKSRVLVHIDVGWCSSVQ